MKPLVLLAYVSMLGSGVVCLLTGEDIAAPLWIIAAMAYRIAEFFEKQEEI